MNQDNKSTEGEKIIEYFLEDEQIKFEREVKIQNLQFDTKDHRRVDFYLPQYKVYLEFLGKWNNPKNRIEYNIKKSIYEKNKLPCIYIYPDNLATLKYIFLMRLETVLKQHNMNKELKFYKNKRYRKLILIVGSTSILYFATFGMLMDTYYAVAPINFVYTYLGLAIALVTIICTAIFGHRIFK